MRLASRSLSLSLLLLSSLASPACSSGDGADDGGGAPASSGGSGGSGGSGAKAGASGQGASSGKGGQAGASGQGGSSGQGGQAGASGKAGQGGSSGQSGASGQAGKAGQAGSSGQAGAAGQAGASGKGGASGQGGSSGQAGAAGQAGSSGQGGQAGQGGAAGAGGCKTGDPCKDGGVCAGEVCCPAARACGDVCCNDTDLCSFQKCVTPGASCQDSTDCGPDEYCELAAGSGASGASGAGGAAGAAGQAGGCQGQKQKEGKCLPLPPICQGGSGGAAGSGNGSITCLEKCEVVPPTVDFTPELHYSWGGVTSSPFTSDVMMTPIVIELDDDDCDGKVTERDIPEIVFTTFAGGAYNSPGTLTAISIVNGKIVEKWKTPGLVTAAGELAAGNIDGQPGNEIVGCGADKRVRAFHGDGTLLWESDVLAGCRIPSIADLDADGAPEVLVSGGVLDGATGAVKHTFSAAVVGDPIAYDVDGDGLLDVATGRQWFKSDGALVDAMVGSAQWPAAGDLDNDGVPEVVGIDYSAHKLVIWHVDPQNPGKVTVVRDGLDINGTLDPTLCPAGSAGSKAGGGPVTIADFNADGFPDVALAGGVGYAVLDGKKLMDASVADKDAFLWAQQTHDCSSAATGSSLFDFNGDGKAEVLYSDEFHFRIYEGATGKVLYETCNTTGTLIEYPVVADVDNDGQADIVVASNAYAYSCDGTKQSGVRVFGSASGSWVRTRRVWNQHAYHITNVAEDGSIPAKEAPNYKQPGLNNFRTNKQPGLEYAAPDVTVKVRPECSAGDAVLIEVRNLGQASLPPGSEVDLYKGDAPSGTLLGIFSTQLTLYPAQAELIVVPVTDPDIIAGSSNVYATVTPPPGVKECRSDNNESPSSVGTCKKF